jgi:AcrR family transcriptional regulator
MADKREEAAEPDAGDGVARGRKSPQGREASQISQRSRLLDAVVEVVGRDGYSEAKIADIAANAGVSRPTFYELFTDKEDCFLSAHRALADQMSAEVEAGIAQSEPARAAPAALTALVGFAEREPLAFGFLTHEAMLAGPRALRERDRLIARLEEQLERAWDEAADSVTIPDVPARILLGGAIRLLGVRMRRGQDLSMRLLADLIQWADCYCIVQQARRWNEITLNAELINSRLGHAPVLVAPQALPRGRHRQPVAVVKRVQRERIVHATADAVHAKGYAGTTVADIVATAGLSREVFYSHFRSRRDAFAETHKVAFERLIAASAGAFFASAPGYWPEQVWEGGRAFATFVVTAPSFANFGIVESYALGPGLARRTDDGMLAFTVFLAAGYRYRPQAAQVPASVSEAIAGAVMETIALYLRRNRPEELVGLLPLITYVILAPFTGTDAANEFVELKLRELKAAPPTPPPPA